MTHNVLLVAPHVDDAEISLGGTVLRLLAQKCTVHVAVLITQDTEFHGTKDVVSSNIRKQELEKSMELWGISSHVILYEDMPIDFDITTHSKLSVVRKLDALLIDKKIDWVFMPTPSFHQEHQFCYECCIAATRPTHATIKLKRIFAYEYPGSIWTTGINAERLGGRYYFDISDHIEQKMTLLDVHQSQGLSNRKLISKGAIDALAKLRGYEAGYEYAEMAYLLRGVE
jgi:N-acetylglucosamine malate deacetylase 1